MNEIFKRIWQRVYPYGRKVYEWLRPAIEYLRVLYQRVADYYRTHPKARKFSLILGPPLLAFFILILVVLIDSPGKTELGRIQNQVASEVYSADSVLLGRYYTQD